MNNTQLLSPKAETIIENKLAFDDRYFQALLREEEREKTHNGYTLSFGRMKGDKKFQTLALSISSKNGSKYSTFGNLRELQDFVFQEIDLLKGINGQENGYKSNYPIGYGEEYDFIDIDDVNTHAECFHYFLKYIVEEVFGQSPFDSKYVSDYKNDRETRVQEILIEKYSKNIDESFKTALEKRLGDISNKQKIYNLASQIENPIIFLRILDFTGKNLNEFLDNFSGTQIMKLAGIINTFQTEAHVVYISEIISTPHNSHIVNRIIEKEPRIIRDFCLKNNRTTLSTSENVISNLCLIPCLSNSSILKIISHHRIDELTTIGDKDGYFIKSMRRIGFSSHDSERLNALFSNLGARKLVEMCSYIPDFTILIDALPLSVVQEFVDTFDFTLLHLIGEYNRIDLEATEWVRDYILENIVGEDTLGKINEESFKTFMKKKLQNEIDNRKNKIKELVAKNKTKQKRIDTLSQ